MEMTQFQRKTLHSWRRMKPHGLTWAMAFRRLSLTWCLLAALLVGVYLLSPAVAAYVACVAGGAMLRDIGYVRSARKVWPVSFAVIDWTRVDHLLDERPD